MYRSLEKHHREFLYGIVFFLFQVGLLRWAEDRFGILHELTDALPEFERPGCGNKTASGSDQQRIAGRLTQPCQRPAHGRLAQP